MMSFLSRLPRSPECSLRQAPAAFFLLIALAGVSLGAAAGNPGGTMVSFKVGDETVQAYLAQPKPAGPHPGVVVIQEWWGLNDQIKGVADRVAALGYAAIVPDLYRGKVAADPELAHELMRGLNETRAVDIIKGAAAYLRGLPGAKDAAVGTVGFCMGGGLSLMAALKGANVQAAAMFYGKVETTADAVAPLRAPVLGLFGADDRGIPVEDVKKFEAALKQAGKDATIVVYPGAGHAFFNQERPSYVPEAAGNAWERLKEFFAKNLNAKAAAS
jgi:carboxymethylenebutenolidase